jgi:hypothetical protein
MPTTIPVPQGLDEPSCIRLLYIGALIERKPPVSPPAASNRDHRSQERAREAQAAVTSKAKEYS